MRLFIAFELPDEMLDALERNLETLNNALGGRFVRPDMLHVTMAFLGEVDGSQTGRIASIIDETASSLTPIDCELGSVGYFGKPSSAVLWQGFNADGARNMAHAADALRRRLSDDGFSFDPKPMRPHVTLARKVDVRGVNLASLDVTCASGTINRIALFHSTRINDQLTYIPIEETIL